MSIAGDRNTIIGYGAAALHSPNDNDKFILGTANEVTLIGFTGGTDSSTAPITVSSGGVTLRAAPLLINTSAGTVGAPLTVSGAAPSTGGTINWGAAPLTVSGAVGYAMAPGSPSFYVLTDDVGAAPTALQLTAGARQTVSVKSLSTVNATLLANQLWPAGGTAAVKALTVPSGGSATATCDGTAWYVTGGTPLAAALAPTAPGPVTGLAVAYSTPNATISWAAPSGTAPITYLVSWTTAGGASIFGGTLPAGTTAYSAAIPPNTETTFTIRAANVAGTSASASVFPYDGTLPTVNGLAGPLSGQITITGTKFTSPMTVSFGGTAAQATVTSLTSATVIVPAGAAGPVALSVTTSAGTSPSGPTYTYTAAPTVNDLAGPTAGGTVTLVGTNFNAPMTATFGGGSPVAVSIGSTTQATVTAPSGTGTTTLAVTTVGGTANATYTFAAAPTVNNLVGPAAGGTVTLIGTNFYAPMTATFGGGSPVAVTIDSTTQATVTAPSGTGTTTLAVIAAGGTSSSATYTFAAAPTVNNLVGPAAGGTVALIGTNFYAPMTATFGGGSPVAVTIVSTTQATVTAPSGTGTTTLTVTAVGGTSSSATYTFVAAPTVNNLAGPTAGGTVTLVGTNFNAPMTATFGGGSPVAVSIISTTQATVTAPSGTGTAALAVTTAGGTANATYTFVAAPTVNDLTGPKDGGTATLVGTNFYAPMTASFGGGSPVMATIDAGSTTQATVTAPSGTIPVNLVVNAAGGVSNTATYSFDAPPVVNAISPTTGGTSGNTAVDITGYNFTGATNVTIGGVAVSSFNITPTQITAITAPRAAGSNLSVDVTTPNGTNGANALFTYTDATLLTAKQNDSVSNDYQGIAMSGTGELQLAITNGGTALRSNNYGATWVDVPLPMPGILFNCWVSTSGEKMVITGAKHGAIAWVMYSVDSGVTFQDRDSTPPSPSIDLVGGGLSGSGDGTFMASGNQAPTQLITSTFNGPWTTLAGSPTVPWFRIAVSRDGSMLIAGTKNSTYSYVYTITGANAGTWREIAGVQAVEVSCGLSADGTYMVFAGYNSGVKYSTDKGLTWNSSTVYSTTGAVVPTNIWLAVAVSDDGQFQTITGSSVYMSIDYGATFTELSTVTTSTYFGAAISGDGTRITAGPRNQLIYTAGPAIPDRVAGLSVAYAYATPTVTVTWNPQYSPNAFNYLWKYTDNDAPIASGTSTITTISRDIDIGRATSFAIYVSNASGNSPSSSISITYTLPAITGLAISYSSGSTTVTWTPLSSPSAYNINWVYSFGGASIYSGSYNSASISQATTTGLLTQFTINAVNGGNSGPTSSINTLLQSLTAKLNASTSAAYSGIALSGTGQYQLATINGDVARRSTDYGATWASATLPSSGIWNNCWVSTDGLNMLIAGTKTSVGSWIMSSVDYGATFTDGASISQTGGGLGGSGTGSFMLSGANTGAAKLVTASAYNGPWTEMTSSPSDTWYSVYVSRDGTKAVAGTTASKKYVYAAGAWAEVLPNTGSSQCAGAISNNGSYITFVSAGAAVQYSSDGGATWGSSTVYNTAGTVVTNLPWQDIAMSDNGQYQTIVGNTVYLSSDYGATFTPLNLVAAGTYVGAAIASDGARVTASTTGVLYTAGPYIPDSITGFAVTYDYATTNATVAWNPQYSPNVFNILWKYTDNDAEIFNGTQSSNTITQSLIAGRATSIAIYVSNTYGNSSTTTNAITYTSPAITGTSIAYNNGTTTITWTPMSAQTTYSVNWVYSAGGSIANLTLPANTSSISRTTTTDLTLFTINSIKNGVAGTSLTLRSSYPSVTAKTTTLPSAIYLSAVMSRTGQYQMFTVNNNSNRIRISSDYGTTWTEVTLPSTGNWFHSWMSTEGDKIVITGNKGGNTPWLMRSSNNGVTFIDGATINRASGGLGGSGTGSLMLSGSITVDSKVITASAFDGTWADLASSPVVQWFCLKVSRDGSRAVAGTYLENANNYIYTAAGSTWAALTGLPASLGTRLTGCAISGDGAYMTFVGENAAVVRSADTGSTWQASVVYSRTGLPIASDIWATVAMSNDGRYQIIGGTSLYMSTDYGVTFYDLCVTPGNYVSVAISDDGNHVVGGPYGNTPYIAAGPA